MKSKDVICPVCNEPMLNHKDLWMSKDGTFHWEHNCENCKWSSDGVPDCVIDGVCPGKIEKDKKEELN